MYVFLFPGAASLAKNPQNCQPFAPHAELMQDSKWQAQSVLRGQMSLI